MAEQEDHLLAQALQEQGILTAEQVSKALEIQKKFGGAWTLREVLLARRLVTEDQLASLQDAGDTLADTEMGASDSPGEDPGTLHLGDDQPGAGEQGDEDATLIEEGGGAGDDEATLVTGGAAEEGDDATLIDGDDPAGDDAATFVTSAEPSPAEAFEDAETFVSGTPQRPGPGDMEDAETMMSGGDADEDAATMVSAGTASDDDLDDAATMVQEVTLSPEGEALEDSVFATICLEMGIASEDQIDEARAMQGFRRKEGKPHRLGAVLVEAGVLETDQVSVVLQSQQARVLACSKCGARKTATETETQPGTIYACAKCASEMTVPDATQEITQVQVQEYLEQKSRGPISVSSVDGQIESSGALQLIGSVIGGCRITKKLGEGGMGAVYLGEHEALRRVSAIKILPGTYANNPTLVARFFREARAAGKIRHQNIVEVFNVGQDQGLHFIEMEFVKGKSLKDMMEEGRIELDEVIRIIKDTATGLKAAHDADVIHRDIKPDNVMVTEEGSIIKIADFGLARSIEGESMDLTKTGQIMGTPTYISPEQADAQKTDQRTDIYSLGATFYHMATDEKPFTGESPMVILLKHINEEPVPPKQHNPDMPDSISMIIDKMMAKRLDQRYQSMEEVIKDIESFQGGATISYKIKKKKKFPVKRVAAAIVLAFLSMATVFYVQYKKASGVEGQANTMLSEAKDVWKDGQGDLLATLDKVKESLDIFNLPEAVEFQAELKAVQTYNVEWDIGMKAYKAENWAEAVLAFERARAAKITEDVDDKLSVARFEAAMVSAEEFRIKKDWQQAIDAFNEAIGLGKGESQKAKARSARDAARVSLNQATFEKHLKDGAIALSKGDLDDAQTAMVTASKIFPDNPRIMELETSIAVRRKTVREEVEFRGVFEKAVTQYGAQNFVAAIAYFEEANLILQGTPALKDLLSEEVEDLDKKLKSANYEKRMADGRAAAQRDKGREAIRRFKEALAYGTRVETGIAQGEIYKVAMGIARPAWADKDEDEADWAITEALVARPDDPEASALKAEVKRFTVTPEGMVYIPGGPFVAGSVEKAEKKNNPQRKLTVAPFYIDLHEVTNRDFRRFVDAGGYKKKELWDEEGWARREKFRTTDRKGHGPRSWATEKEYGKVGPDFPVVGISWYEARAYAKWAGKRLPADEEWEYAAGYDPSTGTKYTFPWGDEWEDRKGNFITRVRPVPIYNFAETDVSPWGCCNMGGNAAEWTNSAKGEPGLRGGSFKTGSLQAKARITNVKRPLARARPPDGGFRCAKSAK